MEAAGAICGASGCVGDPVAPAVQEALVTYDVPPGTLGGSAPSEEVWVTRELNTVVYDLGDVVALSGNQILLEQGTYIVSASQVFYSGSDRTQNVRGRLRNVSDGETVAISLTDRFHAPSGTSGNSDTEIPPTVLTVDALTGFELQYFIQVAWPPGEDKALGQSFPTGEDERYAFVHVRKIQ